MAIVGQNALLNQYIPTFFIKDLVDGQTLKYDSVRKAFINATGTGSGGVDRLGELLNVSDNVDNPLTLLDGQALVYNTFTDLWENKFVDYNTLLNQPTNNDYSLTGLSDTADTSVPLGFLRWNALGTEVEYVTAIPASQITGLADVAIDGTLGSLNNVSPTADTLNNTTDIGKMLMWTGVQWIPAPVPTSTTLVVNNLAARDALMPSLGFQSYVLNSDDGQGNNVGMWSYWIYTITGASNGWTLLASEQSANSESATIEYTFTSASPGTFIIGKLPTGGRITLITVEVISPFNGSPTLEIGYNIDSLVPPPPEPNALITVGEVDLGTATTYTTLSDILFGTDTVSGDVEIFATFVNGGSTIGSAQIIVSYV